MNIHLHTHTQTYETAILPRITHSTISFFVHLSLPQIYGSRIPGELVDFVRHQLYSQPFHNMKILELKLILWKKENPGIFSFTAASVEL